MHRREFLSVSALVSTGAAREAVAQPAPIAACAFRVQRQRFRFGAVDANGPALEGARFGIDADGKTLWSTEASSVQWDGPPSGELHRGQKARLTLLFNDPQIVWIIQLETSGDGRSGIIISTIKNVGHSPVQLGRCRLADVSDSGGALHMGAQPEQTVMFVMSGSQFESRVRRVRRDGKRHLSRIFTQLYNPVSRTALHLGFISFDRMNTEQEVWWDETRQALSASVYCDCKGWPLASGASLETEQLVLHIDHDPYEGLGQWTDRAQAHYLPRIWQKPPAGWVGWSWVDPFHMEKYEDVVRRNAQAIRERLPGLEIDYLWVSLGNLEGRLAGNWLSWNKELFPNGAQSLIQYLDGLGFRFGLWAGAFWLNSGIKDKVEELRDVLLLHNGRPVTVPSSQWGDSYILDPTHPKTKAFLTNVFETYRQWGVRYYMIDFLNAISGPILGTIPVDGYFDRSVIPGPQALREGLRTIREAAGPDTYLLSSSGPTIYGAGLVDATRAGNDYGEGRPLDGPGKGFFPGTFVMNKPDYWTSHLRATNAMAAYSFMHRKLFLSDSGNVLTIDKPVSLTEAQISATIFSINGGPLMLGDDISRMTEERLQMVKQLFPRLPECARAIDLFDAPEPDYPKVFHLPVKTDWDEWHLIAVFNYQNSALRQEIRFDRLGIPVVQRQTIWDFWNESYLGLHSGSVQVDVLPRSVRLLRIARHRETPWLLSTDMHARQGQAEIENVHWKAETMTLDIRASRPSGYSGNAYVRVPNGYALKDPAGLWLAKDPNENCLIVRCGFEFKNTAIEKSLSVVPVPSK